MRSPDASCPVQPFIKWPGGKRWIAGHVSELIKQSLRHRYFEPFLGSGAVFFHLGHKRSILSDINRGLIEAYEAVRDEPNRVLKRLRGLSNESVIYYKLRDSVPRTRLGRAVRLIFLTKTCWGGIYRLNRKGEFNVPFGNSGRRLCHEGNLIAAAESLRPARLQASDFEEVIASAGKGDVVYADPPYTTLGENNGFLRYNERLFAWDDQVRLARSCKKAHCRGAVAVVSGLNHVSLLSLYPGWWVIEVKRKSTVSRVAVGHRLVTEVLITNSAPPADFKIGANTQLLPQRCAELCTTVHRLS